MTKKTLGYVELEWTCENCGTRNAGPNEFCNACGAPQPEDVEFEQPLEQKLITDEAKLARAKAGPDKHCPYCNARNAGDAKFCGACGGDLSEAAVRESGRVVGAHREGPVADVNCPACGTANPANNKICSNCGSSLTKEPVKKPEVRPQAEPSPARKGASMGVIIALGLICVLAVAAIYFLFIRTEELVGRVDGVQWERSIPIEALILVERQDWFDALPSDAEVGDCELEFRYTSDEPEPNSEEVCGTPYEVDTGSGFAEVVQDCVYEVYDDFCTYSVMDWQVFDTFTLTGTDLSPRWPDTNLASDQREGDPNESYEITFSSSEGDYTYTTSDAGEFSRFSSGSSWTLKVNALGSVVSVEPEN
jgi:rRNA maturation endonuclease Nob1